MAQSLKDLLSGNNHQEPPDIKLIKEFVRSKIKVTPTVSITDNTYLVFVPTASAAGSLRVHLYNLQKQLEVGKRVVIRIR